MDFTANSEIQIQEMLEVLGIGSIDELFSPIPRELLASRPTQTDGCSEYEGLLHIESLAQKNTFSSFDSYLGAGAYDHYVPAIVSSICSKSQFLTAYTPYQAEASQGLLQAIFEFQTALCALTGLDAANASVYDGASACAEALLMCLRYHRTRSKVLVAQSLLPHYRQVIDLYFSSRTFELVTIPANQDGTLDKDAFNNLVDDNTAGALFAYPNTFGQVENLSEPIATLHEKRALAVLSAHPLVYGLYASAAELDADIAVGDCQPFGVPLQFGGPYAGYMTCRKQLMRHLPGRIVGKTTDTEGKRGFVLTLQAREQHIRRNKATSNICTNQSLCALAAWIAMLWYGKQGIPSLAKTNYQRAAYLLDHLPFSPLSPSAHFNEIAITFPTPTEKVLSHFRKHHIEPGYPLEPHFPHLKSTFLIAVTEKKSRSQLDTYIACAKELA